MAPHPLIAWLEKKGIKPYRFAAENGLHARPLYAHLNGEVIEPKTGMMAKIEKATGGEVTIHQQVDWFVKRGKRAAKHS